METMLVYEAIRLALILSAVSVAILSSFLQNKRFFLVVVRVDTQNPSLQQKRRSIQTAFKIILHLFYYAKSNLSRFITLLQAVTKS
jgi:hypothetical protein